MIEYRLEDYFQARAEMEMLFNIYKNLNNFPGMTNDDVEAFVSAKHVRTNLESDLLHKVKLCNALTAQMRVKE